MITAQELARRIGIDLKTLRAFVRSAPADKGLPRQALWTGKPLTEEQAKLVETAYREQYPAKPRPAPPPVNPEVVRQAVDALSNRDWTDPKTLPDRPGLYCFWQESTPIYLGIARNSLRRSILHKHLKSGKTEHSHLRRMMRDKTGLQDEAALTGWIEQHLTLRVFPTNWVTIDRLEEEVRKGLKIGNNDLVT